MNLKLIIYFRERKEGSSLIEEDKQKYYVGIDIGGTKTLILIENQHKEVFRVKTKTNSDINEIINFINNIIDELGIRENIVGMAIGLPGSVDSKRGIVLDAPALRWSNKDIKSILKERFSFPVLIENDVSLAIFSEKHRGSFRDSSNMFYISIGTGVGSSIIVNNQVVKGFSYEAGEIGYFSSENDIKAGSLSKTGEFGMLERRISGTALNEKAKHIDLDSVSLFEEYYNDNLKAKEIIDDFIVNLSIVLANVISLLNPEVVIIGGGVSTSMKGILYNIQENVAKLTPIKSKIIISQFGNDSGAIGAVEYIKTLY